MTHLANASHTNSKAEGLYKIATDIHVLTFLIVLKVCKSSINLQFVQYEFRVSYIHEWLFLGF